VRLGAKAPRDEGTADAEADMLSAEASSAMCVQRFDGSRNSAIHTTYRISLRSSSVREPRYPLSKVVVARGARRARRGKRIQHRQRAASQPSEECMREKQGLPAGADICAQPACPPAAHTQQREARGVEQAPSQPRGRCRLGETSRVTGGWVRSMQ
jgi:hypothetical protein